MTDKQKILCCGDVKGNFKFLFTKIENINKKNGPFEFLLCVGDFFGENNVQLEPYKNGMKNIAVPTYIIGPNKEEDLKYYPNIDGHEICQNLTYLGRRGLYVATSGLKIAYISGIESNKTDFKEICFQKNDVVSVKNACLKGQPSFRGVDILLSSPWPTGITDLDPKKPDFKYDGSDLVAWLAAQIKPRYHIAALENIHYERPPYRNHSLDESGIEIATRFIALGSVGNNEKKKWLYALNLTPIDRIRLSELVMKTTDETSSPHLKHLLQDELIEAKTTQFFYDMKSKPSKRTKNSDYSYKKLKIEFDQTKCWFCLSSPEVSKHLVISVGTEVYVALARGGLVEDHMLISPITHHQSLSVLPLQILKEMELYKNAIKMYFASTNRVPVFFERNYKTSHCQLQAVPIHENQASVIKEMFKEIAECNNFKIEELPHHTDLQQIAKAGVLYFYVELPDRQLLYYRIKKDFPLNFGREVLACDRILDVNHKSDWRDCQMNKDKETELAKKIRTQFKPYDVDN
ncbi:hypothetical protein M0802_000773 [Mischocyttarus mexicanus]|nr:hypothetical protein M0802_000773 [Mischocyttarus mexicanus]